MKIQVTQDHIDAAKFMYENNKKIPGGQCCPIALALAEVGFNTPLVGRDVIVFVDGANLRSYACPFVVQQVILDYDYDRSVSPFSFSFNTIFPTR